MRDYEKAAAFDDVKSERDEGRKEARDACAVLAPIVGGDPRDGLPRLVAMVAERRTTNVRIDEAAQLELSVGYQLRQSTTSLGASKLLLSMWSEVRLSGHSSRQRR